MTSRLQVGLFPEFLKMSSYSNPQRLSAQLRNDLYEIAFLFNFAILSTEFRHV